MPDIDKIQAEMNRLRAKETNVEMGKLGHIIYSPSGIGKTTLLKTWPFSNDDKPNIFIDSFDPRGSDVLRKLRAEGKIIVDQSWESELRTEPFVYSEWKKTFRDRCEMGFFDQFDLYVIDSLTGLYESVRNHVIKLCINHDKKKEAEAKRFSRPFKSNRKGWGFADDRGREWEYHALEFRSAIRWVLGLKCHVILFAHEKQKLDENGNLITRQIEAGGKIPEQIEYLPSGIWYLRVNNGDRIMDILPGSTKRAKCRLETEYSLKSPLPGDFTQILEMIDWRREDGK